MNKQTAVEWYNQQINKFNIGTDARVFIAKLFEQAKEMEKEQMVDLAFWFKHEDFKKSEIIEYYNKKFDKEIIQAKIDGAIMADTVGYQNAIEHYKKLKNESKTNL